MTVADPIPQPVTDLDEQVPDPNLEIDRSAILPGDGEAGRLHLSVTDEEKLSLELTEIISAYDLSMVTKVSRWDEINDAYDLVPNAQRAGRQPGSSRLVSEMTRSFTNIAASRIIEGLGVDPLMEVQVVGDQAEDEETQRAVDEAKALERFMEDYEEIDRDCWLPPAVQRACRIGGAVVKSMWERERRKRYWRSSSGKREEKEETRGRLRNTLIDNESVIAWPLNRTRISEMDVFGYRSFLSPAAFRGYAKAMSVSDSKVDFVIALARGQTDEAAEKRLKSQDITPDAINPYKGQVQVCELWCNWPLPGDDLATKFVVWFCPVGKGTVLRVDLNTLDLQRPPFAMIPYWTEDGVFWPSGVGHELIYPQAADSAMWNMKIDNLKIVGNNVRVLRAGTMAETMRDLIAPGRDIVTEDPQSDVQFLALGASTPEIAEAIEMNNFRAMRATSITAPTQGFGDPVLKSGASPTSIQQLIAEAGKKFGQVDKNMRRGLSDLYGIMLSLLSQYAPPELFYYRTSEEDARLLVEYKFAPPRGNLGRFRFRAKAPSAASNREMLKERLMILYRLSIEHANFVMQFGGQTLAQVNPAGFGRMLEGVTRFTHEIFREAINLHELPGVGGKFPRFPEETTPDQIINQLQQELQQLQLQFQELVGGIEQGAQGGGAAPPQGGPPVA